MSASAIASMLIVCAYVWGGFCVLLVRAIGSERDKRKRD
jgi:hypothetical protein